LSFLDDHESLFFGGDRLYVAAVNRINAILDDMEGGSDVPGNWSLLSIDVGAGTKFATAIYKIPFNTFLSGFTVIVKSGSSGWLMLSDRNPPIGTGTGDFGGKSFRLGLSAGTIFAQKDVNGVFTTLATVPGNSPQAFRINTGRSADKDVNCFQNGNQFLSSGFNALDNLGATIFLVLFSVSAVTPVFHLDVLDCGNATFTNLMCMNPYV